MALTVIAAYDISEDQRRARLAALLQAYGDRVQYSVFLLSIDADELTTIVHAAEQLVDLTTDSVWFARQCATCFDDRITLGQASVEPPRLYWAVF